MNTNRPVPEVDARMALDHICGLVAAEAPYLGDYYLYHLNMLNRLYDRRWGIWR